MQTGSKRTCAPETALCYISLGLGKGTLYFKGTNLFTGSFGGSQVVLSYPIPFPDLLGVYASYPITCFPRLDSSPSPLYAHHVAPTEFTSSRRLATLLDLSSQEICGRLESQSFLPTWGRGQERAGLLLPLVGIQLSLAVSEAVTSRPKHVCLFQAQPLQLPSLWLTPGCCRNGMEFLELELKL